MVAGLTVFATQSINALPSDSGVFTTLSPHTLITGRPNPDYDEILKLNFGDYVHTSMGPTHNDQTGRTCGAKALYPSRNTSKGWWFMSIVTGKVIHRSSWTKLPVPKEVVESIHAIANDQKQPLIGHNFKFERLPGDTIIDDLPATTDDNNYVTPNTTNSPPTGH